MRVNKRDVYIGDILETEPVLMSYQDDEPLTIEAMMKPPKRKIVEKSVLLIKVADGLYLRVNEVRGMVDLAGLRKQIERGKIKYTDDRFLRTHRSREEDLIVGNLRQRFFENGTVSIASLKKEMEQKHVIVEVKSV